MDDHSRADGRVTPPPRSKPSPGTDESSPGRSRTPLRASPVGTDQSGQQQEFIHAMREMKQGFTDAVGAIAGEFRDAIPKSKRGAASGDEGEYSLGSEKFLHIHDHDSGSGKRGKNNHGNKPFIEDADPDLERHIREFEGWIRINEFGRRSIRKIDVLTMFGDTFPPASTRRSVFDNHWRRAVTNDRLPQEAVAVLAELQEDLKSYIWETPMMKKIRMDKEWKELAQGGLTHARFRAAFENKLLDLKEAGLDLPTKENLFLGYLTRLNDELATNCLAKEYRIDGEDQPPRKAATWEELAKSCAIYLSERANIRTTTRARGDQLNAIDERGAIVPTLSLIHI